MRIGIDARLYGNQDTGIGRYTKNLVLNLAKVDKKNTYIIFGRDEIKKDLKGIKNFSHRKLTTRIYSVREQIINPFVFKKAKLDLLHVPNFNAPLFYFSKQIITIHDLIKHISVGVETSNLPVYQYWAKHFAYRLVVYLNIYKSKSIITPSKFWKDYLINQYNLKPGKVNVTYEAADKAIKKTSRQKPKEVLKKYLLEKPFVVYTGNLYPHKNVDFLIKGIKKFNKKHKHQLTLAIICSRGVFKNKLVRDPSIRYLGYVPDEELSVLYSQALALVQPSLIEGFGLTGLEAMASDLAVLSSNATCLPEVYGDAALYFDPHDLKNLILRLEQVVSDREVVLDLKRKGRTRVKRFSWYKTAKDTLAVYRQVNESKK